MSLLLVIGGTRSGKSARAERLALATGLPVRYVATADSADPALAERIGVHAARRPASWATIEAREDLAGAVETAASGGGCVLLDGLGTWIAGALHRAGSFEPAAGESVRRMADHVHAQVDRVVLAGARAATLIVVAEDAGRGVLPAESTSRAWLDLLGAATQRLSAAADQVELVVAGRAVTLPTHCRADLPARPANPAGSAGAAELRRHGDRDVRTGDADHAVNVLAGGPPPWLRDALATALADAAAYPDERAAIAAIAALHDRDPSEVVPTNGAAEALWLLPLALRPRLAVCVHPAFTEAEAALRAHGVPVARVQRDPDAGFALDPAAVPAAADVVIVGNPASPSGTLDPAAALLALRRPGRVIVVDEAFMGLVPGEPASLAAERLDDVIVVRSLTKALAVPGLRVGYLLAAAPLARLTRAVRPPWSANALALATLTAAALRPDALAAAAERAAAERVDLERHLVGIAGLRTWPSVTNFCLVEVSDGPAVLGALRAHGIAVRPAASFPGLGAGHLRLTARDPGRNARLAAALAEAVA